MASVKQNFPASGARQQRRGFAGLRLSGYGQRGRVKSSSGRAPRCRNGVGLPGTAAWGWQHRRPVTPFELWD